VVAWESESGASESTEPKEQLEFYERLAELDERGRGDVSMGLLWRSRHKMAQARAIEHADFALLNSRDAIVKGLAPRAHGKVVWFDQHEPKPPMPLPGRHNLENALAAAAIGRVAGLDDETINRAISGFRASTRLELVGEWGGSLVQRLEATNPERRVALTAFPGRR
jgi:UDP-N-acetylmuramoylalanine-D-glutamate ligase